MSGAGPASPGRSGSALPLPLPLSLSLTGDRKREVPTASTLLQPIIKDVGEIYSRLLDHRPVIQGEIRYFVKEFEEKRGLRELRVLENLKKTIFETNGNILPKCEQSMQDNLSEVFQRCIYAWSDSSCKPTGSVESLSPYKLPMIWSTSYKRRNVNRGRFRLIRKWLVMRSALLSGRRS
uniref:Biogenesis of lysosome-related organelles complex 1 subunit 5 n=1 Tax=Coturnix japonica TaxID=93934 RepID=A0A8C2TZX7_COTJA